MSPAIESVIKQAIKTFSFPNKDSLLNFNENFRKLLGQVSGISSEEVHFEDHLLTQQVREVKRYRRDLFSSEIKIDVRYVNRAPVTYVQIFENEYVTLGVFIIREGNKLPLHNHPLMHGIIKVLAGTLKVTSYSVVDSSTQTLDNMDAKGCTEASDETVNQFYIPGLGTTPIPCYEEPNKCDSQDSAYNTQETPEAQASSQPRYCSHNTLAYLESPTVFTAKRHSPLLISASGDATYLTPVERNIHEIHCVNGPAAFLDVIGPPYKPVTLQDCTYFEDLGEYSGDKSLRRLQRVPCPSYFHTDEEKYKGPPLDIT